MAKTIDDGGRENHAVSDPNLEDVHDLLESIARLGPSDRQKVMGIVRLVASIARNESTEAAGHALDHFSAPTPKRLT